ncbi:nucleotide exchange factor GrpE [Mongoliitalea daihaiensis]|nr:nucleotide exchange factor GrpE [Mongoliitalea daihaiensis]
MNEDGVNSATKEMNEQEQLTTESVSSSDSSTSTEESTTISEVEKLRLEVSEAKEKYLRLYSEFDNFRRRTAKEKLELTKTASEDVLREIIPIVDDFERAFKASEKEEHAGNVREGNQLVFHKLVKTLESKGLTAMTDLVGKPFDAETQEAITQILAPSEDLKGKVIDVVEKGYTLGDKVVRYAKVVIGA